MRILNRTPRQRWVGLTQRLLLEGKEYGVDELDVFKVVVDHVEEFESLLMYAGSISEFAIQSRGQCWY